MQLKLGWATSAVGRFATKAPSPKPDLGQTPGIGRSELQLGVLADFNSQGRGRFSNTPGRHSSSR